ncbi:MAG: MurR/RpiR family transcriptional regulator [Erysipelothrix sp.]|nr:MurR/RpiR family transcriptional regulator [Erysipelothrix sp.]
MRKDIFLKIREELGGLTEDQKRIGMFIIADSEKFINLSSNQIAKETMTSGSEVTRFAKRMEYSSLEALKRDVLRTTRINNEEVDPILNFSDFSSEMLTKMKVLIKNAIDDLFDIQDSKNIQSAVELIKQANRVYIYAIGASSLTARDLYLKLNRVGKNTIFEMDSHTNTEFIHNATPHDVVILISYSGRSKEIIYPGELALAKQVPIITITSNTSSKLVDMASVFIPIPQSEGTIRSGAITSKLNSQIIADLLYLGTIKDNYNDIEKDLIATSRITSILKEPK